MRSLWLLSITVCLGWPAQSRAQDTSSPPATAAPSDATAAPAGVAGPAQSGEVQAVFQSTFVVPVGPDGRTMPIPAWVVDTGGRKTVSYAPPFAINVRDIRFATAGPQGTYGELDAADFARRVTAGEIPLDAEVVVTLPIDFAESILFSQAVLEGCLEQRRLELSDQEVEAIRQLEPAVVKAKAVPQQVRRFTLRLSFGNEVLAVLESAPNPVLASRLHLQATISARLAERITSSSGVTAVVVLQPLLMKAKHGAADRLMQVEDLTEQVLSEVGKGGLRVELDSGDMGFLVERRATAAAVRRTRYDDQITIQADDIALLELVSGILQDGERDLFAVTEAEVEKVIRQAVDWRRVAETPGFLETLDRFAAGESYSRDDYESLVTTIDQHSRSSGGGGGLSAGPIAIGGGGGDASAESKAHREQSRKQAERLSSWLRQGRVEGKFPVPPSLDLSLVTRNRLDKAFAQSVRLVLNGPAFADSVSFVVNTTQTTVTPAYLLKYLVARRLGDELLRSLEAEAPR